MVYLPFSLLPSVSMNSYWYDSQSVSSLLSFVCYHHKTPLKICVCVCFRLFLFLDRSVAYHFWRHTHTQSTVICWHRHLSAGDIHNLCLDANRHWNGEFKSILSQFMWCLCLRNDTLLVWSSLPLSLPPSLLVVVASYHLNLSLSFFLPFPLLLNPNCVSHWVNMASHYCHSQIGPF